LRAIARAFGGIGIDRHLIWADRFADALRAQGFEATKIRP
jgi:hypothetical protein